MKTQVNKLRKEQALGNKIVLFYLVIFGIIAFSTSGKNFSQSISEYSENTFSTSNKNNSNLISTFAVNSDEKRENFEMNYLIPLQAEFYSANTNELEMRKLNGTVTKNSRLVYTQMLIELANIEEPELLIEDILSQLDIQVAAFNALQSIHFIQKQNAYLNEMYKEKTQKVFDEIEQSHQLNKMLLSENESKMDIEFWMTDGIFWKLSAGENKDIEQSLAEVYAKKNADVYNALEMEMKFKSWGSIDSEKPLIVEDWMIENYDNAATQKVGNNEYLANIAKTKNNEVDEMIELISKIKKYALIEKEAPLVVEPWMVSERCWCPNKRQRENWYSESFALNEKN